MDFRFVLACTLSAMVVTAIVFAVCDLDAATSPTSTDPGETRDPSPVKVPEPTTRPEIRPDSQKPPKSEMAQTNTPWTANETLSSWERGGFWRFNWPNQNDFQKVWRTWGSGTRAYTVVLAVALSERKKGNQIWRLFENADGTTTMAHIPWPGGYGGSIAGKLSVALDNLRPGRFHLTQGREKIRYRATRVIRYDGWHRNAFDDWVYARTMLTFEPPAQSDVPDSAWDRDKDKEEDKLWKRVEAAMANSPDAGLAAIEAHLGHASNYDSRWGTALAFVEKHGSHDLLLKVYAIYRPVGRCSMDTYPQQVAREHADACAKAGRLGCYLQMSVRIMADNFMRTAYSSYGEASHNTESSVLDSTGLDTNRFLRGLLMAYPSEIHSPVGIGLWRLARAMKELGRTDTMLAQVEAWVVDLDLDETNRLRATITLSNLYIASGQTKSDTADYIRALDLSETAAMWIEKLGGLDVE